MPRYPAKEADITALTRAMIAGFTEHSAVFPNADTAELQSALDTFMESSEDQIEALAQAKIATEKKHAALEQLRSSMKRQIKQSQIDTTDNPQQLNLIGWGPRAKEHPTQTPGQPLNLRSSHQDRGTLILEWKKPARKSGGKVQTYIIERREEGVEGDKGDIRGAEGKEGDIKGAEGDNKKRTFSKWKHAGFSLQTEVTLTDQPRGVQMEYQVKAINKAGHSHPSNSIAIVL